MSLKRLQPSLSDVSPALNKHVVSSRCIDPHLVLQGLENQNITADEALLWVKPLMQKAIDMPVAPEAKKKQSQKVCPGGKM